MSWTAKTFTDLDLDVLPDSEDPDLIRVTYVKELFIIRLSSCRITPSGIDFLMAKRTPLMDADVIPHYDWTRVKELKQLVRRGTKNHHRVVWVRNDKGIPVGIK